MGEIICWIVAALAGALSIFILVGNPIAGVKAVRSGRNYSSVPLVGGVLGVVACVVCPVIGWSWWSLLPLALDYTVPGLLYAMLLAGRGKQEVAHLVHPRDGIVCIPSTPR